MTNIGNREELADSSRRSPAHASMMVPEFGLEKWSLQARSRRGAAEISRSDPILTRLERRFARTRRRRDVGAVKIGCVRQVEQIISDEQIMNVHRDEAREEGVVGIADQLQIDDLFGIGIRRV